MRRFWFCLILCLCLVVPAAAEAVEVDEPTSNLQDDLQEDLEDVPAAVPIEGETPENVQEELDPPASAEGDSIVLVGGEEEEEEGEGDEIVFPAGPYPVYIVDAPDEVEGAAFEPATAMGTAYAGTITTAIYEYFRDITATLPWGDHYVFFRRDQYNYVLAYGPDLVLNGSTFSAPRVSIVNFYNYSSQATYGITRYVDNNFSVSSGYANVYSDLGVYPRMFEGVTRREHQALIFAVVMFGLITFVRGLFVRR